MRATSTPTQRTTAPDARPRATHPSGAPSPKAVDVGDVLLVLDEVGRLSFLDVQSANPSRQRFGHQSSFTWVIQLLP